jgi:hypothetical protein
MSDVNINSILDNIKQVSLSPSSMDILREFERVIDENGCYAFHHYKSLELVEGPIISAYRIKCIFMSPLKKMPDPAGAARLLPYGVKISYKKAWLKYPIKIKSENDFRSGIKKPKIAKTEVWLVYIDMPKYLIKDITRGSKEIMDQEMSMDDIDDAYEEGLDSHRGVKQAEQKQEEENPGL